MVGSKKSIEEKYKKWLSKRLPKKQLPGILRTYFHLDDYFLDRKILKVPIFETTDPVVLEKVKNIVETNRFFRFRYRRQISQMGVAVRYYIAFIKEKGEFADEDSSDSEDMENVDCLETVVPQEDNIGKDVACVESAEESEQEEQCNVNVTSETADCEYRKKEFSDWMISKGMSNKTARIYISALGQVEDIAKRKGVIFSGVFEITDPELLKTALQKLLMIPEFVERNASGHNQYRGAWTKYILFSGDSDFDYKKIRSEMFSSDDDIKQTNSALYMRLKSMASVYDDVNGFDMEWIRSIIGIPIETEELKGVLDKLPWVTEVRDGVYSFSKNAERQIDFDRDAFMRVLGTRYPYGMRMDSIDLENFRETYKDIIEEEISLSDKDLILCLRKCGILYKDRVFPPEGIINNEAKEKLLEYVGVSFDGGNQVLYYKAIYSDLSSVFASCFNLTEALMLKPYLEYVCTPGEYFFGEEYMSKEENIKVDHTSEIEDYMIRMGKPLSYDELYEGLSHISKEVIYSGIKTNRDILLNEKEHYFHIGIFEFSQDDADKITDYIRAELEEEGYCIWSRVFKRIQTEMPLFIENNAYLSALGIRNAIAKKLSGRFNFDSEVISSHGQSMNMAMVYKLYGQHHAPFSDTDIYEFSKEVSGGAVYFDSLSESTVRVARELFVTRGLVDFDVDATDKAIASYMSSDYIPIKEIDSFLVFPNVGYEWNIFLLESYLMYFSAKYVLSNNGRSLNNVAGVVVRKGKGYEDFVNVCAEILAKSEISLSKNKALDYLADLNLLTRRSYSKIEEAIDKAKEIRNKRG
ncbi:MAG: hypothetical protein IKQ27_15345 [Lachnospiraceae bacterium]|nr:hypothetical protein [Lachnospiraceae bacterium]MBR6158328.1 hypothetical protein [Lachnospiraceae bacterium]